MVRLAPLATVLFLLACNDPGPAADSGAGDGGDGAGQSCETPRAWFLDYDGDGYGHATRGVYACEGPEGYVDNADDCHDSDDEISPAGVDDTCDGIDNDCDGTIDPMLQQYTDADGDGFGGEPAGFICAEFTPQAGFTTTPGDCDDANPDAHPGLREMYGDDVDSDCDGAVQGECGSLEGVVEVEGDDVGHQAPVHGEAFATARFRGVGGVCTIDLGTDELDRFEVFFVAGEACDDERVELPLSADAVGGVVTLCFRATTEMLFGVRTYLYTEGGSFDVAAGSVP